MPRTHDTCNIIDKIESGRKFKDNNRGKEYCVLLYNNDDKSNDECFAQHDQVEHKCFTEMCKSGIRFIEIREIPQKICANISFDVPIYIRKIVIPDKAEITTMKNGKTKSDKLHFKQAEFFWSDPKYYEICKEIVSLNGEMLVNVDMTLYTEIQKENIAFIAVEQNEWAIRYAKPTISNYYELCKIAVQKHWHTLRIIDKKYITIELYELAIKCYNPGKHRSPILFRDIPLGYMEQNLHTVLLQVEKDGMALKFIKEHLKTIEICTAAVKNNGLSLEFVPINKFTTEELVSLCTNAVTQHYAALQYCCVMTSEIYNLAIQQNPIAEYCLPEKFIYEPYVLSSSMLHDNFSINDEYINSRYSKKMKI
jgi:hypothetical protein